MTQSRIEEAMRICIKIANKHQSRFGAAIIDEAGEILYSAYNTGRKDGPLAHAEMNVLRKIGQYRGQKLSLVTTCEPCPMCAGAAVWSGISAIYYGVSIEEASQYLNQINVSSEEIINASWLSIKLHGGILRNECLDLFTVS